jgi:hypothetical protein
MTNTTQNLISPVRKFDALAPFYQIAAPLIGYSVQQLGWTVNAYCAERGFVTFSRWHGSYSIETLQICFDKQDGKFGGMRSCDRIVLNIDCPGNPISNLRIDTIGSVWNHLHLANLSLKFFPAEPAAWFSNLMGGE